MIIHLTENKQFPFCIQLNAGNNRLTLKAAKELVKRLSDKIVEYEKGNIIK